VGVMKGGEADLDETVPATGDDSILRRREDRIKDRPLVGDIEPLAPVRRE
jgi:hypothetical protein